MSDDAIPKPGNGDVKLEVTERQMLPCETDRRAAWWAVILATALAIVATAAFFLAMVVTVKVLETEDRIRGEADREIQTLQRIVSTQDAALSCRAEARADYEFALAAARLAAHEVTIETANQFYLVLQRRTDETDPATLRRKALDARLANSRAAAEVGVYREKTAECSPAGPTGVGGETGDD